MRQSGADLLGSACLLFGCLQEAGTLLRFGRCGLVFPKHTDSGKCPIRRRLRLSDPYRSANRKPKMYTSAFCCWPHSITMTYGDTVFLK